MMQKASKRFLRKSSATAALVTMPPQQALSFSDTHEEDGADEVAALTKTKELETEPLEQLANAVSPKPRQPRAIGGPIHARHRQTHNKQVDFYRDPTILSRLALNQKYTEAKSRLRRHPQEASIWVAAKRKHQTGYSIRQLPLHICCMNLKRALDPTTRQVLNDLIVSLIVAYPNACRMVDHSSVLPVHAALWYGAAPEAISMCFMAYPESVNLLDKRGRACSEILQGSRRNDSEDRTKLQALLLLKTAFWKRAQTAAKKRLANADIPWDSSSSASLIPSLVASETESSETTESSATAVVSLNNGEDDDDDTIEPMAWEQLEARAMALEQVLTEVNEVNFDLNKRIELLSKSKTELQHKLDKQRKELGAQVASLQSENAELKARLAQVEKELAEARRHQQVPPSTLPAMRKSDMSAMHLHAMLEDLGGSPKTPDGRRRVMQHLAEQQQNPSNRSLIPNLGDSVSLSDDNDFGSTRKDRHRSPGYRRRGLRSSARSATNSGLEDSIAFEELLEVDQGVIQKSGKDYHNSSTSLTESSHSYKSSQSFMSSRQYVKVLDDNRQLLKELDDINRSYRAQRTTLQRLEAYVEELQNEEKEESEKDAAAVDDDDDDEHSSSSSGSLRNLSHVPEGDEGTTTTFSSYTGPWSSKGTYAADNHVALRLSNNATNVYIQDIVFVPSPTSSADDFDG